jgi:hypothetical protein
MFGGDWGVSLIRKRFRDGSTSLVDLDSGCAGTPCGTFYTTTSDTSLLGVEVHRFVSFATIKQRVQIGLNIGGGVGRMRGSIARLTRQPVGFSDIIQSEDTVEASELFQPAGTQLKAVPLARLELAVAGIVAPGLKVRVGGGLNLPGYSRVSMDIVYLFGVQ